MKILFVLDQMLSKKRTGCGGSFCFNLTGVRNMETIRRSLLSMLVLIVVLVSGGIQFMDVARASAGGYHSAWYGQSGYLTMKPGEVQTIWIKFKNTGTATWYNTGSNPIDLGTSVPLDRSSGFYTNSWLSPNRPARMSEASVAPGGVGTFVFEMKAPVGIGFYREYFRPLAENLVWMEDNGVYIDINVAGSTGGNYSSQLISQSGDLTLDKGEEAQVWVEYKNTGSTTWYKYGTNPVHLGTNNPQDRASDFYDNSWLSVNRAANMDKSTVYPGEYVKFTFDVKAPYHAGYYTENFKLVAEGSTWMNDTGLNWEFRVKDEYSDNDEDFDLTARNTDDGVELRWDEYDKNNIDSYRILRSEDDSTPDYPDDYLVYVDNDENDYLDEDVDNREKYYYRVAAYEDGKVVAYSESVSITYYEDDNNNDYTIVEYGDFNLRAENVDKAIELEWDEYDDNDVDSYKIMRSTSDTTPDYDEDYYDHVSGNINDYTDDDIEYSDRYYYRVGAYKNSKVVAYSDSISIYYDVEDEDELNLTADSKYYGIELDWDEYDDRFDSYVILRSTSNSTPDYDDDYYSYVDDDDTDFLDEDVKDGKRYYYRVAVYDGGDILAYSNSVSITYQESDDNFYLTARVVADGVKLEWDEYNDNDIDSYKILRSTSDSTPDYPGDYYQHVGYDINNYLDKYVDDNQGYYYRIAAYDNGQVVGYSETDYIVFEE